MIIALAGRKECGKSELAKVAEKAGYCRISFATALKRLIATLIGVELNELDAYKNTVKDYDFGETEYQLISQETGIPIDTVRKEMSKVKLTTVRQMMQFIGTDIIRKFNPDWHIQKTLYNLDKDKDYVVDDLRFPNEKNALEKLGAVCFYIMRPTVSNVSNHISETSLGWRDFEKHIVTGDRFRQTKYAWAYYLLCVMAGDIDGIKEAEVQMLPIDGGPSANLKKDGIVKIKDSNLKEGVIVVYDTGKYKRIYNTYDIEDLKALL